MSTGPREEESPPRIYLDHAATTPVRPEVRRAMEPFLRNGFGNPSSLHREGRAAREALEEARESIRARLRGGDFRLVFTGGGTEADNAAIIGTLLARLERAGGRGRMHVVASAVEHVAVLGALEFAARLGFEHTLVPVDRSGWIDPDAVLASLRPETVLVSIMAANNEVGTLEPIGEIGARLRERGIPLHTDAIQLLGKRPLELDRLPVDLVAISAHKIHGPKGVGGLLVRTGLPFQGFIRGGAQEDGLRGGTEEVTGAVGFARAVELALDEMPRESVRLERLCERLRETVAARIDGVSFNGPREGVVPHILSATFARVEGESLLRLLDHLGVAVSTGSACNVGARKPSHVLRAMGLRDREVRGTIRFSPGLTTSEGDIDESVRRLTRATEQLRAIAPPC